jgi:hypothetical protein
MKNPKVKAWLSLIMSFALRRHVSTRLVQERGLKADRNSRTCEIGAHDFKLATNPYKHCVGTDAPVAQLDRAPLRRWWPHVRIVSGAPMFDGSFGTNATRPRTELRTHADAHSGRTSTSTKGHRSLFEDRTASRFMSCAQRRCGSALFFPHPLAR